MYLTIEAETVVKEHHLKKNEDLPVVGTKLGPITAEINVGAYVSDMSDVDAVQALTKHFGTKTVRWSILSALVIAGQSNIRNDLIGMKAPKEIMERLRNWVYSKGAQGPALSQVERLEKDSAGLAPDQIDAFIVKLREQAKAMKKATEKAA